MLGIGIRHGHRAAIRAGLALCALLLAAAAFASSARAEFTSTRVAYVYDPAEFTTCSPSCGLNDTSAPESGGSSIFARAVEGKIAKGETEAEYTPAGGSKVTLKNVSLEEIDAKPNLLQEGGFDTAILYQTCRINSHPTALAAVNAFLESAHKVMIFDADGCAGGTPLGEPNWSGFLFPFATNNPGPEGASGPYTSIEPSTLTTGLSLGEQELDAVGDANIFTTASAHWFQAIAATNISNVTGTVMAYSRTASGGLALYEGEDFWFTDRPDPHLTQVFDNLLNQHWNPDKLPSSKFVCAQCSSTVTTKLSSTLDPAGLAITDSATVTGASPAGTATGKVTFTVYSDPHCQLPVAGQAQSVTVATGGATTAPITLPAGTYYFQAQYSGDSQNFPGISACGSEVLTVVPDGPPVERHRPVVNVETGEVEWELEIPEEGELEDEGELFETAELSSLHHAAPIFSAGLEEVTVQAARKHKSKKCKKGFVKKHGKCLSRAPLHFSKGKVHVPSAGVYKLRLKPSGKILAALKKGKKLRVRINVTFTPAQTTIHLTKSATVRLELKKKKKHKHKKH